MIFVSEHIKHIQLLSKRLMREGIFGHARSLVKGVGLEFEQLRDYCDGDDVRAIDWNSSARMNKLLIKQFNDERHRTMLIVLDISASTFYGTQEMVKQSIASQLAAIISYAAFLGKDEVGLILLSDRVECYIPARRGKAHVQSIIEKIFSVKKSSRSTSLCAALDHIIALRKKNAMVFLISDFIDQGYDRSLALCSRLYEVIAIRILDVAERVFPAAGLITVRDSETGQLHILKGKDIARFLPERADHQKKSLISSRVDFLDVTPEQPLIDQLIQFFRIRN